MMEWMITVMDSWPQVSAHPIQIVRETIHILEYVTQVHISVRSSVEQIMMVMGTLSHKTLTFHVHPAGRGHRGTRGFRSGGHLQGIVQRGTDIIQKSI